MSLRDYWNNQKVLFTVGAAAVALPTIIESSLRSAASVEVPMFLMLTAYAFGIMVLIRSNWLRRHRQRLARIALQGRAVPSAE